MEEKCITKLVKSFLDIIVLSILNNGPQHGYKIIADIHRNFGVLLSPGTLYPFLYSLEESKLVEVKAEKRKKVYFITSLGRREMFNMCKYYKLNIEKIFNFFNIELRT